MISWIFLIEYEGMKKKYLTESLIINQIIKLIFRIFLIAQPIDFCVNDSEVKAVYILAHFPS